MIFQKRIIISTDGENIFHNITKHVKEIVKESNIVNGLVHVYSKHTTMAIKITEDCRLMQYDCKNKLRELAPREGRYSHDLIDMRDVPPDERINGFSHIRQLLMNTSETLPLMSSKIVLGEWQNLFAVELDPNRAREIIVTVVGE